MFLPYRTSAVLTSVSQLSFNYSSSEETREGWGGVRPLEPLAYIAQKKQSPAAAFFPLGTLCSAKKLIESEQKGSVVRGIE